VQYCHFQRELAQSQQMVAALQRALAAQGQEGAAGARAGAGAGEGAGDGAGAGETRGCKRTAWSVLEGQGKRAATAPIQQEISALAQERATTPVAIAANIIAR
jgi:hypothetical protein